MFHVFVNTRRSRLLEDTPGIKPRSEDDWEADDISTESPGLLSAITTQQKVTPVVQCELSRIVGQCLSTVINKPQQDPRRSMAPLDAWRKSLSAGLHVDGNAETDLYYLHLRALSYRYECILCRVVRRQRARPADVIDWAKQRLRSAILELDTIVMRVLGCGTLHDFPISL